MLETNFWQDKNKAQKVIKEKKFQEDLINSYNFSVKHCKEIADLFNLAVEENNISVINDSLKSIEELKKDKELLKSTVTSHQNKLKEIGIGEKSFTELIVGLPDETRESHIYANRKLIDLGFEVWNYFLLVKIY